MRHFTLTLLLSALFVLSLNQALAFPLTPNSKITTGSLCTTKDGDYTEDRYEEKIAYCKRNVSAEEKARIYRTYGIPKECWKRYTIDHFYPLSMGGSNNLDNLWPEHKYVKNTRMNLEMETFTRLQNGEITQKEALEIIKHDKLNPGSPESNNFNRCDRLD